MTLVHVSVGSNVDPENNIPKGLRLLADHAPIVALSTFYRTRPVGPPGQPGFVNGVVACRTGEGVRDFKFQTLRGVEAAVGRRRTSDRYAPRPLDLDILVWEHREFDEPDLNVPDPELYRRPFLAIPLAELEPDLILPDSGQSVASVAHQMQHHTMEPMAAFTAELLGTLEA